MALSVNPDVQASLDAMPLRMRLSFVEVLAHIESPAHLYAITYHLQRGDLDLAFMAAHAPSAHFACYDPFLAIAFALGRASKG